MKRDEYLREDFREKLNEARVRIEYLLKKKTERMSKGLFDPNSIRTVETYIRIAEFEEYLNLIKEDLKEEKNRTEEDLNFILSFYDNVMKIPHISGNYGT